MKKIMFNDRYGLTAAVINGNKTMTRRIIPQLMSDKDFDISEWGINDQGKAHICLYEGGRPTTDIFPAYQSGEVVAVAQSYNDVLEYFSDEQWRLDYMRRVEAAYEKLWDDVRGINNKMFVKSELMLYQIQITDIKVERLQDISDEDCMNEGVLWDYDDYPIMSRKVYFINDYESFPTPRAAFASLINRVCGKSTWELNPFVFAYSFELWKLINSPKL